MKSSLTLLCLVVWVNVDASSAQTGKDVYKRLYRSDNTGSNEPKDFCGPPPHLMNGDTMGHNRERYRNGESVHYECQKYYILDPPSAYKTCQPCTVDEQLMNTQNIQFKYLPEDRNKQYAEHIDHITFKCTGHLRLSPGSVDFCQQCINGVMNLPHCQ
uniref:Sushi domain-containing protein n=1 Tax=Salmo trutta TaxID=8032 RepID=A0A674A5H4_SALTR